MRSVLARSSRSMRAEVHLSKRRRGHRSLGGGWLNNLVPTVVFPRALAQRYDGDPSQPQLDSFVANAADDF